MGLKDADGMANNVDPDQTAPLVMGPKDAHRMANNVDPDLDLHCLHRTVCPKT